MGKISPKLFFWRWLSDRQRYRLLEMIPGGLVWLAYILLFVFSFINPVWVIYFTIVYAFLWLVRVGYFVFYMFVAWGKFRRENQINWLAKLQQEFANKSPQVSQLKASHDPAQRRGVTYDWEQLYHAVFLPTWKEPYEVLKTTLEALRASHYPLAKIIVIIGGEARAGRQVNKKLQRLAQEYESVFGKLMVTVHPDDLPGELKGKSANANYMAAKFHQWVDEQGLAYEDIIVSNFDSDTAVHPQYLARLSYAYLQHPRPTRASYQPLALYNNNLWESPSFTRVVANSTSFWLMTELARPEQFMTFSSHSMSFRALVDVNYWDKTIVTEDSRIFLQCFFHYEGEYSLVPIYIPINMDTVAVKSLVKTVKNQYLQMRRWAWSVEHQPYLIRQMNKHPRIPRWTKLRYWWKLLEGQFSWATAPVFLMVFSRLPLWIASSRHETFVLVQNAPFLLERILGLAMIGMVISAYFNIRLLPGPPPQKPWLKYPVMILQWFLLPLTLIVFGSIPAIDAQTRLMLGKYLGFWNTEKERIKA